jgi:hypothetical protein
MSSTADFVGDFDIITRTVALTAGISTQILFNNPQRFAFVMTGSVPAQAWMWPGPMAAQSQGILITNSAAPQIFNFRQHGALATIDWFAFPAGAGQSVNIIEVLYKPVR